LMGATSLGFDCMGAKLRGLCFRWPGPGLPAREAGSLVAFVAVVAVALFALFGLVVDGGEALASKREAAAEAEQAARSGADALSVDALRDGQVRLNPVAALAAAEHYLQVTGHPGSVQISGNTVTVEVSITSPTSVLSMVGIDRLTVSATASATALNGVTG